MSTVASFVSGRRTKFAVLARWVLVVMALGPLAGRFEGAQRNEPSSFLPEGAESVEVLEASAGFPTGEVTPAVAVFRDPGGLGGDDHRAVALARGRVGAAGIEGVRPLPPVTLSRAAAPPRSPACVTKRSTSVLGSKAWTSFGQLS
jgi:hypothetical protein